MEIALVGGKNSSVAYVFRKNDEGSIRQIHADQRISSSISGLSNNEIAAVETAEQRPHQGCEKKPTVVPTRRLAAASSWFP